jgi:hypothetical protein
MQWLIIIMDCSKTLLWSSKFPRACKRMSSKYIDDFGTRPRKVHQPFSSLQRTEDIRLKFRHARGCWGGRRRLLIAHRHASGLGRHQKPAAATDAFLYVNLSIRGSAKFGLHADNTGFSIQNKQDRQYTYIHSESVSVALVIQYAKRMRPSILSCGLCSSTIFCYTISQTARL